MPEVDVMAFGAHPDDIELGCGGTLIKLTDLGHTVVLVDMTQGEMSTRGTVETRKKEAAAAAAIIGATARENLELPDGGIGSSSEGKAKVAEVIRTFRPRMVFVPYGQDRHPDHVHTSQVVYEGVFLAGLSRYETEQSAYRPSRFAYYMGWYEFDPTFIVDITDQYERKMEAIYAYSTQFKPDDERYAQTRLTSPAYNWFQTHRMGSLGSQIQKRYGEGFLIRGTLEAEDPMEMSFISF
jgi:bacillithiol biosynthesis deacetylase BshB1